MTAVSNRLAQVTDPSEAQVTILSLRTTCAS